jgi:hypothetical protein
MRQAVSRDSSRGPHGSAMATPRGTKNIPSDNRAAHPFELEFPLSVVDGHAPEQPPQRSVERLPVQGLGASNLILAAQ